MVEAVSAPDRFSEIFERYFSTIHAYLTRRLGRSRADDLTSDVFRIAFAARDRFDPSFGGVRPWLYGIANNVLRENVRAGERAERAWTRIPAPGRSDGMDCLDDQLDAQRHIAVLQQALDRLNPFDREALVLFAVEQLTYSEVAALMNTPIGTVRSRISRARSQLRHLLAPGFSDGIETEGDKPHG